MKNIKEVAEMYNISEEQARDLKRAIDNTWDYVGYDYIDCCGGEDEALKIFDSYGQMVAEATVDADRLRQHGDVDWFYKLDGDILKIAEEVYTARF